jgi:hypothetical protein
MLSAISIKYVSYILITYIYIGESLQLILVNIHNFGVSKGIFHIYLLIFLGYCSYFTWNIK